MHFCTEDGNSRWQKTLVHKLNYWLSYHKKQVKSKTPYCASRHRTVKEGAWKKSSEWIWSLWHIKMEMRFSSVHQINSVIGSVKAIDATLPHPHRMTLLMGRRTGSTIKEYNLIHHRPLCEALESAFCFHLRFPLSSHTLTSPLPSPTLSPLTSVLFPTFSDCWVFLSGSSLFSACCPVYEAPPSKTWQLPLPPWAQPAFWFAGLETLLRKATKRNMQHYCFRIF